MEKRKIIIGSYDTAYYGWTLTGWAFSEALQKTLYISKAGGDGSWDMSTALTDGIPRYEDRQLTATLECSEGDRASRNTLIAEMVNLLDGMRLQIELPDDPYHYIVGRVHVRKEYSDLAHAAVTVTATCDPWKYYYEEISRSFTAATEKSTITLSNRGRRAAVPSLLVAGGDVLLEYGTASISLSAGTHQWPELLLTPGSHVLTYSGTGTVTVTYREAVLE